MKIDSGALLNFDAPPIEKEIKRTSNFYKRVRFIDDQIKESDKDWIQNNPDSGAYSSFEPYAPTYMYMKGKDPERKDEGMFRRSYDKFDKAVGNDGLLFLKLKESDGSLNDYMKKIGKEYYYHNKRAFA